MKGTFRVCGSVLLGAALTTSCTSEEKTQPPPRIRPVRYQEVAQVAATRMRTFSGAAKAAMESKISFKVAGTISTLDAEVGDSVREGQLIAELDDRDYHLRVKEAEAVLVQAGAQLRNASANFDRTRALYENDNASRNDYDTARTAVDTSEATVEAARRRLELSEQQLTYTRLAAPLDGAIAQVGVEVNENVSSGQPIVTLNSINQPEVQVAIPEQLIAQIRPGGSVTVRFDAIPGRSFKARVTEVGIASTPFATTFPVTVRLARSDSSIRPGMSAEVDFRFRSKGTSERLRVPTHSVGEDRQGRFVYVLEPAKDGFGHARRRAVTVGEITSEGLEIVEGLSGGELVVTAGLTRITAGQEVRLLDTD